LSESWTHWHFLGQAPETRLSPPPRNLEEFAIVQKKADFGVVGVVRANWKLFMAGKVTTVHEI
jgi:hypothetical protein